MNKYKTVEVICLDNDNQKLSFKNIRPFEFEDELNRLAEKGWLKFSVVIDGKRENAIIIDKSGNLTSRLKGE